MEHKKLLILGLGVMLFTGGSSSNFNIPSGSDDSQESNEVQAQAPIKPNYVDQQDSTLSFPDTGETADEQILMRPENEINPSEDYDVRTYMNGEKRVVQNTDEAEEEEFVTPAFLLAIESALSNLTLPVKALLALEALFFVVYLVIFGFFVTNWAQGSLIAGMAQVADTPTKKAGTNLDLHAAAARGAKRAASLIWIQIVPALKLLAKIIVASVVFIVAMAILVGNLKVLPVFLAVTLGGIGLLYVLYLSIRLGTRQTWALRYSIWDDLSGSDAFKKAVTYSRGYVKTTFRVGFYNVILQMLIGLFLLIPLIAAFIPIGLGAWAWNTPYQWVTLITIPYAIVAVIAGMLFWYAIGSFMKVLFNGVFHFLVLEGTNRVKN